MPNPIQNFRQIPIVFEKPGILSKKLTTLTNANYYRVQFFFFFFFLKFGTRFLLNNVWKGVFGIFLFCLDLELFAKIEKDLDSTNSQSFFFFDNSRSKQNEKNSDHSFIGIGK